MIILLKVYVITYSTCIVSRQTVCVDDMTDNNICPFRSSLFWNLLGMQQPFKTVTQVGLQCTMKSTFLQKANYLEVGYLY